LQLQLKKDLFVIGRIEPDEDSGLLTLEDWDRIFRVVNKHVDLNSDVVIGSLKK
jgi:hypothetical protein